MKKFKEYKEMLNHYMKRTKKHIALVQKYGKKIYESNPKRFKDLPKQLEVHDQSKFEKPEKEPYIHLTWKYKMKDDGKEYAISKELQKKIEDATLHHIVTNSHHPEYHSIDKTNLVNKKDRDGIPNKIVDATKMREIDLAEMCADFCGMSEEKGNSPKEWLNKTINKRWKFTDKQVKLIYDLVKIAWEKK